MSYCTQDELIELLCLGAFGTLVMEGVMMDDKIHAFLMDLIDRGIIAEFSYDVMKDVLKIRFMRPKYLK